MFPAVKRILRWQLWVMAVVGSVAMGIGGWPAAGSALMGGVVGFIPNAYFAVRFGTALKTRTADQVVRAFYAGEATKLLITAALFLLVFQLPGVLYLPLFAGFLAVLAVFWFALLFIDSEI
jgi:ATP synthase protein I